MRRIIIGLANNNCRFAVVKILSESLQLTETTCRHKRAVMFVNIVRVSAVILSNLLLIVAFILVAWHQCL